MDKRLRLVAGLGLAGLLGACSHSMSLRPLDGGPSIKAAALVGTPMTVKIDGKTYRGGVARTALNVAGPPPAPIGGGVYVGRYPGQRGAGGSNVAELRAADGSMLVCRFDREPGDVHGSGLCRTDQGRTFSLVID